MSNKNNCWTYRVVKREMINAPTKYYFSIREVYYKGGAIWALKQEAERGIYKKSKQEIIDHLDNLSKSLKSKDDKEYLEMLYRATQRNVIDLDKLEKKKGWD